MLRLHNMTHRIAWLIFVELRYKKMSFGLMFLVCFALLLLYYWNPTFQISSLLNELLGQGSTFSNFSGRTYVINGITYFNSSSEAVVSLKYHINYFPMAFYGLGFAVISLLFSEYGDQKSNRFSLSIPASPLEKWLSKLIIAFFIYPLIFLTLYQLFALLTYQWGTMRGFEFVRLHLTDPLIWTYVLRYLLIAAIIMGLATYFKKRGLIKIGLFAVGCYFMLGIILNLMVLVIFPDFDMDLMTNYFSLEGYKNYIGSNRYIFGQGYIGIREILTSQKALIIVALFSMLYSYLNYYELEA